MEALNELVKAGKVRALGASAMYGYQFYNMRSPPVTTDGRSLRPWRTIIIFFTGRMSGN